MADDLNPAAAPDVAAAFRRAYPNLGPEPHGEHERQARAALAAARDGEAVDRAAVRRGAAAVVEHMWDEREERCTAGDAPGPSLKYAEEYAEHLAEQVLLAARGAAAPTVTADQVHEVQYAHVGDDGEHLGPCVLVSDLPRLGEVTP